MVFKSWFTQPWSSRHTLQWLIVGAEERKVKNKTKLGVPGETHRSFFFIVESAYSVY